MQTTILGVGPDREGVVGPGEYRSLRFDDMLATLLAQPAPTAEARALLWRQVVDVLAQGRGHRTDDPLVDAPRAMDAYNFLRAVRPEISVDLRLAAGRGLAGRRVPPDLVLLFAEDLPNIAAPMLGHVILSSGEWLRILDRLGPGARNILRNRRDLGQEVEQALAAYGTADLRIDEAEADEKSFSPLTSPASEIPAVVASAEPAPVPPAPPVSVVAEHVVAEPVVAQPVEASALASAPAVVESVGESQIRNLLSRIESFRTRHPLGLAEADAESPQLFGDDEPQRADNFRFETGVDGIICWVQGVPRGPLIGETIAVAAHQTDHGVDGHAAGAYRSRTPFRDARLTIAGQGPAAGEWRISAVPFFDQKDGRFSGYRGTARRPRPDETAKTISADANRPATPSTDDSLRHLAHELRTPLNAIIGFSEMIDGQMRGPAAAAYRTRAQEILEQSRKLLSAVEDLDLVAAARTGALDGVSGGVDAGAILTRLHADFELVAKERASAIAFRIDPTLPPVAVDEATVERILSRLLAATIAMASEGERISVDLQRDPRQNARLLLTILRPRALLGRDEKMLLDPGYNPDGNWPDAPVLGLGFALRLVRNLAIASGGMLEIDATRFYLSLPLRSPAFNGDHGSWSGADHP